MAFGFNLCWLNRHSPDRRNAAWDGNRFVSHCKHCGKAIVRIRHRKWVGDERAASKDAH